LLLAAALLGAAPAAPSQRDLALELARAYRALPAEAHAGVLVLDREGRTVFTRNADKLFLPASAAKLFVAAAVLDLGAPDLSLDTALALTAPIGTDGVVHGDLVLLSSGDPLLTTSDLSRLVDELYAAGVLRIEGELNFLPLWPESLSPPYGWSWEDLNTRSGAPRDVVCLDRNIVTLICTPTVLGKEVHIAFDPPASGYYFGISNNTRTVLTPSTKDELRISRRWQSGFDATFEVAGTLASGASPVRLTVPVFNGFDYCSHILEGLLVERGIDISDSTLGGQPSGVSARHTGPSLRDLVHQMLKQSDNLIAEQLALFVAGLGYPLPGTRGVHLADASGLSRYNLVSPRALVHLLSDARGKPWFADFRDSLPVAGVDGTLASRFTDGPARGRVRAKTGTMGGVSTLAGYVLDDRGDIAYTFAILVNNFTEDAGGVRAAIDALVTALAQTVN